jgi:hypothetical protein
MVRTVVVVRSLHAARERRGERDGVDGDYAVHWLDFVYFPPLVLIRLVVVTPAPLRGRSSEVRIDGKGSNRALPARTRVQG